MKPFFMSALFFVSITSFAEPTLYPKDVSILSNIKNSTTSNIMADEVDPRTVWVLPPNSATAVAMGLHTKRLT